MRFLKYNFLLLITFASNYNISKNDTPKKNDTVNTVAFYKDKFQLKKEQLPEIKKNIGQMLQIDEKIMSEVSDNDFFVFVIEYLINLSIINIYISSYEELLSTVNTTNAELKKHSEELNSNIGNTFTVINVNLFKKKIEEYLALKKKKQNVDILIKASIVMLEAYLPLFSVKN